MAILIITVPTFLTCSPARELPLPEDRSLPSRFENTVRKLGAEAGSKKAVLLMQLTCFANRLLGRTADVNKNSPYPVRVGARFIQLLRVPMKKFEKDPLSSSELFLQAISIEQRAPTPYVGRHELRLKNPRQRCTRTGITAILASPKKSTLRRSGSHKHFVRAIVVRDNNFIEEPKIEVRGFSRKRYGATPNVIEIFVDELKTHKLFQGVQGIMQVHTFTTYKEIGPDKTTTQRVSCIAEGFDCDLHDLVFMMTKQLPFNPELYIHLFHGCIQGLTSMHESNRIHGDISETNILLKKTSTSPLTYDTALGDLGYSATVSPAGVITNRNHLICNGLYPTLIHTCPDIFSYTGNFVGDARKLDIHALGVCLFIAKNKAYPRWQDRFFHLIEKIKAARGSLPSNVMLRDDANFKEFCACKADAEIKLQAFREASAAVALLKRNPQELSSSEFYDFLMHSMLQPIASCPTARELLSMVELYQSGPKTMKTCNLPKHFAKLTLHPERKF